jgi:hypothetical protein
VQRNFKDIGSLFLSCDNKQSISLANKLPQRKQTFVVFVSKIENIVSEKSLNIEKFEYLPHSSTK